MTRPTPLVIARAREAVIPAMRAAVAQLEPRMALVAGYQLNWNDEHGQPIDHAGGKALRPTLAVISAEAAGGTIADGVAAAVAVELVHNFSLLHDDVMDRDLERRHRPTGWVVFGDGQAILAGNAMLTLAFDVLLADGPTGVRALPCLTEAVHQLISGQSDDLAFEGAATVDLASCLHMEAGKTGALLACSAAIGAAALAAPEPLVTGLWRYGAELGMAFQLVDDILGITGDPEITGKSSSSDVRAGKRSAPVVAALTSGTDAGRRLEALLEDGPPASEEEVALATALITEAGGLAWAADEADRRLAAALGALDELPLAPGALHDLVTVARYVVERDR
jgi:geranylgeranyl diphosphate synthase, type I